MPWSNAHKGKKEFDLAKLKGTTKHVQLASYSYCAMGSIYYKNAVYIVYIGNGYSTNVPM